MKNKKLLSLLILLTAYLLSGLQAGVAFVEAFDGLRFEKPLAIVQQPNEKLKLFIVEKAGRIFEIPDVSQPTKRLFLDIRDIVYSEKNEQGLLAMAFHPRFSENGYFYLFYNVELEGKYYDRLSRFSVYGDNPFKADPNTELVIINQLDQAWNHNGGDIHFGPDGYMYLSLGDEGRRDDRLDNSQTIEKDFYSGIIRIDVDRRLGNLEPNKHVAIEVDLSGQAYYRVPIDNPFVDAKTYNGKVVNPEKLRTEFWATGLRNPWRFAFDSKTNEIYCGDVGQNKREEINIIEKGGNYGWAYREASISGFKSKQTPTGFKSIDPVFEYERTLGVSVTGGVVVRNSRFDELNEQYVFADYAMGNVWLLSTGTHETNLVGKVKAVVGFGLDPSNGDVLMASLNGSIKRLVVK